MTGSNIIPFASDSLKKKSSSSSSLVIEAESEDSREDLAEGRDYRIEESVVGERVKIEMVHYHLGRG